MQSQIFNGNVFFRTSYLLVVIFFIFISVTSCKKEDGNYILLGKVTNGNNNEALGGVNVKIMKQTVSGGTFGGTFNTAATTSTDATGMYELKWARENFSALRVVAEKNQTSPEQSI